MYGTTAIASEWYYFCESPPGQDYSTDARFIRCSELCARLVYIMSLFGKVEGGESIRVLDLSELLSSFRSSTAQNGIDAPVVPPILFINEYRSRNRLCVSLQSRGIHRLVACHMR